VQKSNIGHLIKIFRNKTLKSVKSYLAAEGKERVNIFLPGSLPRIVLSVFSPGLLPSLNAQKNAQLHSHVTVGGSTLGSWNSWGTISAATIVVDLKKLINLLLAQAVAEVL
jgi:hypothetical protein